MSAPTQRDKLRKTAKANNWSITEREQQNETRYTRKGLRILVRWQYDTVSYVTRNGEPWLNTTDADRSERVMEVLESPATPVPPSLIIPEPPRDNRDLLYEIMCMLAELDEGDTSDFMFWPVTPEGVRISVLCSDVFYWGCADAEIVTQENLPALRQAYLDEIEASPDDVPLHPGWLFVARQRNLRPQGAIYKGLEYWEVPLFDAAGPPREINFGNPQNPQGEYKWPESDAYKELMAKRGEQVGTEPGVAGADST